MPKSKKTIIAVVVDIILIIIAVIAIVANNRDRGNSSKNSNSSSLSSSSSQSVISSSVSSQQLSVPSNSPDQEMNINPIAPLPVPLSMSNAPTSVTSSLETYSTPVSSTPLAPANP